MPKTRGVDEKTAYKAPRKLATERSQLLVNAAANLIEMAQILL